MKVGLIVPQGWTGEYVGWAPRDAWARSLSIAAEAESLGFDSLWVFDHFHTTPEPTDEITFESFATLAALAGLTNRVELGHVVACAGFRNPALTAKAISTIDVISGGRVVLGIGAGWKREEWESYGYRFPSTAERLSMLAEQLEIITHMLADGSATFEGDHHRVFGAINQPRGLRSPGIPIMVGGNGPRRTWRIAARFADELNLDAMTPEDVVAATPVISERCREIGRDPRTLAVSVHVWWEHLEPAGAERRRQLDAYRKAGVRRIQVLLRDAVAHPSALEDFADDCEAAGAALREQVA
ncbi:MAG TPA: TIGR03560 family F420-dependent LLM class oxidoreductase [Candidatus Limnocylindria bacterium]|nr:TIGR03560 family F420-dependent LLM class oxidoreductase [Candidatus Limnocylindria bacterium]